MEFEKLSKLTLKQKKEILADLIEYDVSYWKKILILMAMIDKDEDTELLDLVIENKIEEIGNPMHAILQIKEKQIVQKILLDMPEFLEFIRDNKGISLSEHIEKEFADMISFMQLR